jgi:aryl-alcohol dehydrogenase-like predicted oxidoreductase
VEYRRLGRTGLSVSEIGYGAWGIGGAGWVGAQEEESARALHHAFERRAALARHRWERNFYLSA